MWENALRPGGDGGGERRLAAWQETQLAQSVAHDKANPGGRNERVLVASNAVRPAARWQATESMGTALQL